MERIRALLGSERGAVVAMVAVCMVALLGATGLALDLGRGYLTRATLARAVDAGTLGGARSLRAGQAAALERAIEVAALNGADTLTADLEVAFGSNEFGEATVRVTGTRRIPTMLMGVLGKDSMTVQAVAEAAVPPVDLVLVLDQSGSLIDLGAWDELQDAAMEFVENFDDALDQMGLVSFQLRGTERVFLAHGFESLVDHQVDNVIVPGGDTNAGEGLRIALEQLTSDDARDRSAKVVVFFTDGRPTAFRDNLFGQDRVLAVYRGSSNTIRGLWNDPDDLPTDDVDRNPNYCRNVSSCGGWDANEVRAASAQKGLDMASAIRAEGFYVYSIGLGDPDADDPLEVPDLDYLRQIANEEGVSDSSQPQGKSYFAPSEAELRAVFNQVAQDLLVRLAQ